jgi:hypothetical protein
MVRRCIALSASLAAQREKPSLSAQREKQRQRSAGNNGADSLRLSLNTARKAASLLSCKPIAMVHLA